MSRAVVGMHFFNPAPVMKLVEVIAGMNTKPETVARIKEISVEIGKTPVEVKEAAGFVVNRILIPMINEAVGIYAEGVASAEDIDTAMKLGANHPMGPLSLGDLIGLDVCLAIKMCIRDRPLPGQKGGGARGGYQGCGGFCADLPGGGGSVCVCKDSSGDAGRG